jgi:hypothetical protein
MGREIPTQIQVWRERKEREWKASGEPVTRFRRKNYATVRDEESPRGSMSSLLPGCGTRFGGPAFFFGIVDAALSE